MTIPPPDPVLVERFGRDVAALDVGTEDAFGVAVSGGADSLALLLLADAALPGRVRAISIDHGLRADAADECRFVREVSARLGVDHDIVAVTVARSGEGLQADARRARETAFGGWCRRHRLRWLMTGHHADDQAETLLMRIARGAGVGGLGGMAARRGLYAVPPEPLGDGTMPEPSLLRPLLGWTRDELAGIVGTAGLTPIADPSNDDPRFDRTRFRALLRGTDLLDPRRLAATASHCRDAEEALGFAARTLMRTALRRSEARIELIRAEFDAWPREIVRRLVLEALAGLGAWPEPRGAQIIRLIGLLRAGRTATLAGIKVTPGDVWTFTRATPRRAG